jgi:MFS family permease
MQTATATPTAPAKKPGLFINRNFGLLWIGQTISYVGDFVFDTTLVLWIATSLARGQSWAPLAVSGVLLAVSVPVFAVGPLAGVFVDRWDKRRTMLAMDALRAIFVFLLLLASEIVSLPFVPGGQLPLEWQLGAIYGVVFLASVCVQFFIPARLALIGDIVAQPHHARAFGQSQVAYFLAFVLGPPLAALLFFTVGVQWALALNACSFLVSFLTILAVRAPRAARSVAPGQRGNFLRELVGGLRFLLGNPALRAIAVSLVLVIGGVGALQTLGIFFVTQNLRGSASLYGFLASALGVGSIAGAILTSMLANRIGVARIYWLSLIVVGALIVVLARMTDLIPAFVVIVLLGLPYAAINVAVSPLQLEVTPRVYVGRVASLLSPAGNLALIFSVALAGYLDSTALRGFHMTVLGVVLGPIDTIFTAAGILIVLGGLYAMASLRGMRSPRERTAEEKGNGLAEAKQAEAQDQDL